MGNGVTHQRRGVESCTAADGATRPSFADGSTTAGLPWLLFRSNLLKTPATVSGEILDRTDGAYVEIVISDVADAAPGPYFNTAMVAPVSGDGVRLWPAANQRFAQGDGGGAVPTTLGAGPKPSNPTNTTRLASTGGGGDAAALAAAALIFAGAFCVLMRRRQRARLR